jgi:hypothetical protein
MDVDTKDSLTNSEEYLLDVPAMDKETEFTWDSKNFYDDAKLARQVRHIQITPYPGIMHDPRLLAQKLHELGLYYEKKPEAALCLKCIVYEGPFGYLEEKEALIDVSLEPFPFVPYLQCCPHLFLFL